ncbi:MAG: hypothetical protein Q4D25_02575 [Bacteroidales bacterium]|nr:hypothetical protein [Bacteroidales bacterium]
MELLRRHQYYFYTANKHKESITTSLYKKPGWLFSSYVVKIDHSLNGWHPYHRIEEIKVSYESSYLTYAFEAYREARLLDAAARDPFYFPTELEPILCNPQWGDFVNEIKFNPDTCDYWIKAYAFFLDGSKKWQWEEAIYNYTGRRYNTSEVGVFLFLTNKNLQIIVDGEGTVLYSSNDPILCSYVLPRVAQYRTVKEL